MKTTHELSEHEKEQIWETARSLSIGDSHRFPQIVKEVTESYVSLWAKAQPNKEL